MAAASVAAPSPVPGILLTPLRYLGLLVAVHRPKNFRLGALPAVFGLTGFMGYTLSPPLTQNPSVFNLFARRGPTNEPPEKRMKCPHCPEVLLVMADRSGIEIDYCPQCRGVWLDRGELDKLLERAAPAAEPGAPHPARREFADSDYPGSSSGHVRRRKSWLNDIFD